MEKPIIAIVYDFDKTLCDQDMQNYSFIPNLDMKPEEFWGEIGEFSKSENMEAILSYSPIGVWDSTIPVTVTD